MTSAKFVPRPISPSMKRAVFNRDGRICQMCGSIPTDVDPYEGNLVRLTIGHVIGSESGPGNSLNNLRVICSTCSAGIRKIALPKPDRVHLLSQIRRATIDDQQAVLDWLLTKFGLVANKKI